MEKKHKKHKINSGQEYVSRLGKKHQAKTILPACGTKCIFKRVKIIVLRVLQGDNLVV
jgi:hypothetical protein